MNKLRALLVDDEELARRGLEIRLDSNPHVEVCGHSRNGREALALMRDLQPDIVFLDIQMPGMDGFEMLREMPATQTPVVIFVTAYDKYAIRAFEANAVDYLLKPINDQRLSEAIDRAREHIDKMNALTHRTRLLKLICDLTGEERTLEQALADAGGEGHDYAQRLAIRDGREVACVDAGDIDCVEAAGDYVCVHTGAKTYVLRGTMKRLEQVLDPTQFVRVHRSTIVNAGRVQSLRPHNNGEYFLMLEGDKEVKLSRSYRDNLSRLLPRHDLGGRPEG